MSVAADLDPGFPPVDGADDGLDFGLSDTDFGAGLITLAAALCHDVGSLDEAGLVETVGLLESCVRWVQSEVALRVAELARRRGGPTDEGVAMAAATAEQNARTEGMFGPGKRSGREPRPRFWEQIVLGARLGLGEFDARRLVATSVALYGTGSGSGGVRLPKTAVALGEGRISWKHAEALATETARLSDAGAADVEVWVLGDAAARTAGQYRRRAKERAQQLEPVAEAAPRVGTAAMWELADGTVKLDATFDPDGGRILARAVDAYATPTGGDDERPAGQRWADALVEIGRVALDHLDPARAGSINRTGRRPHLTLIADTRPTGTGTGAGTGAGTVVLEGAGYLGPLRLDPAEAGWLTCCADVQTAAVDSDGRIVGLGDVHKRMPGVRLRRQIALRDQGCRAPGCTRPAQRCLPHHVVFHADGGPSTAANLLSLCDVHHQAVHRDRWHIQFDGTTAVFTDPHGRQYQSPPPLAAPQPHPPDPDDGPVLQPHQATPPDTLTPPAPQRPPARPTPAHRRRGHAFEDEPPF